MSPRRIQLVHGPTPLVQRPSLSELLGVDLWLKRDDATGGAEAGNKLRKLEFLLADALAKRADTVITCGGIQSNHARATALTCAELGLKCVLYLREARAPGDPARIARREDLPAGGNVLLDRLAGAELHLVTPAEYAQRGAVLESEAQRRRAPARSRTSFREGGLVRGSARSVTSRRCGRRARR